MANDTKNELCYAFPVSIFNGLDLLKSTEERERVAYALLMLFFRGVEPSHLTDDEQRLFDMCAGRTRKSRTNSNNRKTPTKGKSKPQTNGATKEPSTTPPEGVGEGEEVLEDNPPISPQGFPWACLNALNVELGVTYASMPDKCTRTLQRFEGTYDLEAVKAMIRYKRDEWQGTKWKNCLTPNTLFSPDHFEQYIHQSQADQKEAETYAIYDR